jgi:hypothetical protein
VIHLRTARHGHTMKRDYPMIVPDTGGEWRYVTVDGPMDDILFIENVGAAIDIDHININAEEGVVVLRGMVEQPDQIVEIERRVREVHGVRGVENLLHVNGSPTPTRQ